MPQDLTAIDILARLVAFDTVSARSNRALIDWVEAYLAGHGIAATIVPGPDGKASLYATVGPSVSGGVVLSGHTDVVPTDGQSWTSDPFALSERSGKLFGRGTADMKGFVALCLALLPEIKDRPLRRPVHVALSHDEEIGCLGAPALVAHMLEHLPRPEIAIVGEPTMMRPVNAHKGINGYRTTVRGRAGHSSAPQHGANAILHAVRVLDYIAREAAGRRRAPILGSRFEPPYSTFNIGTIEGGTAVNIIPGKCSFRWEFRTHPGDDPEAIYRRIATFIEEEALPTLRDEHPEGAIETVPLASVPVFQPERDGAAEMLARRLTGANGTGVVAFATEAGIFQAAGISTIVCGPGDIAQAHQPDEFITRDQMEAGAAFLRRLADWAAS
jgi:acetylornithine deacetylase